jgi:hypothetical protein
MRLGPPASVLLQAATRAAERLANHRRSVDAWFADDRQIGARNDEIQAKVIRRAALVMSVRPLDEDPAADDPVEELLELRRLVAYERVEAAGRFESVVSDLNGKAHPLLFTPGAAAYNGWVEARMPGVRP